MSNQIPGRHPGSSWANPIRRGKWRMYWSVGSKYVVFVHDDYNGDWEIPRIGSARSFDEAISKIDELERAQSDTKG